MDKPKTSGPALEGVYRLADKEVEQAKMIVKAGDKAGVSHYIWSTLEDTIAFFGAVTEDQPKNNSSTFRTFGTLAWSRMATIWEMSPCPPYVQRTLARARTAFSWAAWMANILVSLSMSPVTAYLAHR
eukprot:scaffold6417_cov87-Cyclotella_meneghiniana.AAC.6